MNLRFLNFKMIIYLIPLIILGCGSGGGNSGGQPSPQPVVAGRLELTNVSNVLAKGSTHQYIVNLKEASNIQTPIQVKISSSNSNVAAIESNSCAIKHLITEGNPAVISCDFFVRGNNSGTSYLTIAAESYPSITEPITVKQQWITFAPPIRFNNAKINKFIFKQNKAYALTAYKTGVLFVSDGYTWQMVGNEGIGFGTSTATMAIDGSTACVAWNVDASTSTDSYVKCSVNNGKWLQLPLLNDRKLTAISLRNNTLYVQSTINNEIYVDYCSIFSCEFWTQKGTPFYASGYKATTLFESTSYVWSADDYWYYQTDAGDWQKYGYYYNYNALSSIKVSVDNTGMFILNDGEFPTYSSTVYYHSNQNIGGIFNQIGNSFMIPQYQYITDSGITSTNNGIAIAPGDGNVYTSLKIFLSWAPWQLVGYKAPKLNGVYYDNNKLYSTVNTKTDNGSVSIQIYVYPLD